MLLSNCWVATDQACSSLSSVFPSLWWSLTASAEADLSSLANWRWLIAAGTGLRSWDSMINANVVIRRYACRAKESSSVERVMTAQADLIEVMTQDDRLLKIRSSSLRNSAELSGSAARRRLFLRNSDPIHKACSSEKISPVTTRLIVVWFQSTMGRR